MCAEFGGEMSLYGSSEEKYNMTCGMTLCSLVDVSEEPAVCFSHGLGDSRFS
jgi:hypothetical protein